jgi:hypothetical protein
MPQWLTVSASSDHVRGHRHDSHDPSALHASASPDDSDHSEDGSNRPLHRADDPSALLPTDSDVHAGPSTLVYPGVAWARFWPTLLVPVGRWCASNVHANLSRSRDAESSCEQYAIYPLQFHFVSPVDYYLTLSSTSAKPLNFWFPHLDLNFASSYVASYVAESFWRVALTPVRIPSPTSTIPPTTIQCVGTCIKLAP